MFVMPTQTQTKGLKMGFSTRSRSEQGIDAIQPYEMVKQGWERMQKELGIDLEETARESKAIQRVPDPECSDCCI